jgi:chromosome segregation protein
MRLDKIKLAGFKSFVDPTTVHFPSNLVGIVGPNGCGKSNVIDAVRWVMGETSAKMLRGESMADVIFNGSSSRKPVGTASIELIFDNADGSAGGQYAQYSEISVKRAVSRDGQSNYYLNGVRCRRRDIADLFLGTGLGPRSYAIIEQGMISRLIEARPEDLRAHLEEAAGISKYKERRKETERRISHTRENLDRLNDLREEVAKQLRHLERQAATAEKYKTLKGEERQARAELLALKLRGMAEDIAKRDRAIAEQENRLQAAIATQRELEANIEAQRSAHAEANEAFNEVQGRFYAAGAEIARLEEAIQYARESRRQQEQDLAQAERTLNEAQSHRQSDQSRLEELAERLEQDLPQLEEAQARVEAASEILAQAETAMQDWQSEWDAFNEKATEPAQTAQVERTRINSLEQQESSLRRRLERLDEERQRLADVQLQAEINELERREGERQAQLEELAGQTAEAAETITRLRDQNAEQQQRLNEARTELETGKGRLASLQALQQDAMGEGDSQFKQWLDSAGLSGARRLLERIEVDAQWQTATEAVLGHHLQALCVDDMAGLAGAIAGLQSGRLTLMEQGGSIAGEPGTLAAVVRGPAALTGLLGQVRTAPDLDSALRLRDQLADGQSVVTPEGVWLGRGWLRYHKAADASAGVLAREQELRELSARLETLDLQVEDLAAALAEGQQTLAEAEHRREEHQRAQDAANRQLADIRAQLSGKRARAEQLRHRLEALEADAAELREQIESGAQAMESARSKLHQALADMEELGSKREALVARRDDLRRQLDEARNGAQQVRNAAHEIALRVESMRSSEQSLRSGLDRASSQLEQLRLRVGELRDTLAAAAEPLAEQQQELESKLAERVDVERQLSEARKGLEAIDHKLRELEQSRHHTEQRVQDERGRMDQARMARQEVVVRANTLEEQLVETGFARADLEQQLPQEARVGEWEERVSDLSLKIQRLGPINLAAIDEFKEQSERMEYLDKQYADVTTSLETLEEAIRKIDRETRTRFKETFDKVNSGLKELFPKLFGGGHAYLELTGEDLLDTGVAVMARPPGKRNSSIHLLSGGEKALTAVAMVFAIFQLNPAPFCMLDEVDAPLDDANVSRFSNLVKEMSDQVQFIFITHNKVTMEIASQLSGVTMHEPGVSRLVSVDVDAAAQLAAVG